MYLPCSFNFKDASTSVIAADNKQDTDKYNFLVIVCEDISPYLGCYGDSVAVSPHLDNFSQDAIRHEYMFTCVVAYMNP